MVLEAAVSGCASAPESSVAARAASDASSPVAVEFVQPQKFTDLRLRCFGDKDTAGLVSEMGDFLRASGERYVPDGGALRIKVTNVDMAGEFEPWRGSQFCETRSMLDVHVPRIDLEFRLTDAQGAVIRAGTRHLTDALYLSRPGRTASDRLRHEKGLLADWLQKELGDVPTSPASPR